MQGEEASRLAWGAAGAVSPNVCEWRKPRPLPDPHQNDFTSHSAHQSGLQHLLQEALRPPHPGQASTVPAPHGWPGTLCSKSSLVCEPWDPGWGLAGVHRARAGLRRPSWPGPEAAGVTQPCSCVPACATTSPLWGQEAEASASGHLTVSAHALGVWLAAVSRRSRPGQGSGVAPGPLSSSAAGLGDRPESGSGGPLTQSGKQPPD